MKKGWKRAAAGLLAALTVFLCGCGAEMKTAEYSFVFVDEAGAPVPGVTATLCDDEKCVLLEGGESGRAVYTGEPRAYVLHVLRVPEGYENENNTDTAAPREGGEVRVVIPGRRK